ncbi:MAG: DUF86 domain-containing protein [Methanocorpusculum sp.]|nr:DUF86 domain-containing protein [Methanocorpusculum sp.]
MRIFHIRDEIDYLIETFSSLTYEEFVSCRTLKLSAQKSLEIIGEAANNISDELKEKYPDVPWALMRGLRNRLTHKYFDVSWPVVWEIIEDDIPPLKSQIQQIIEIENYVC